MRTTCRHAQTYGDACTIRAPAHTAACPVVSIHWLVVEPLLFIAFVVVLQAVRWPFDAHRAAQNPPFNCSIRVDSGTQAGLTLRWQGGKADARPGGLWFRPGGPIGLRFPRGKPVEIIVTGATSDTGKTGIREAWSVNPLLRTRQFSTPTATFTIAASPAILDHLSESLVLHHS
jgi:hypothetical protein